jgi:hypothetical protein
MGLARKKGHPMIATLATAARICLMTAGSAALYLLPLLIGLARQSPRTRKLATVNILLGWTVAGWAAALAIALRSARPAIPAGPAHSPLATRLTATGQPGEVLSPRPGTPPPLQIRPRPAAPPATGHQQPGPEKAPGLHASDQPGTTARASRPWP